MAEDAVIGLGMQVTINKSRTETIRVNHITSFPELGSAPETKETTNKDNQGYRSYVQGLQDLPVMDFVFNAPPLAKDGSDLLSRLQSLDRSQTYDVELTNPLGKWKKTLRAQVSVRNNANTNDDVQTATLSLTASSSGPWKYYEAFQMFYDSNGGKGPQPVDLGWYEPSDNVIVLDGEGLYYGQTDFRAWNTSADGTGTEFLPGAVVNLTGNMTLFAQYGELEPEPEPKDPEEP